MSNSVTHCGYMTSIFDSNFSNEIDKAAGIISNFGDFEYIAMRGLSGTIFGSALCYKMNKKPIVVRKERKTHSSHRVEGMPVGDFRFIIVDDFIAYGNTISAIFFELYKNKFSHHNLDFVGAYMYEWDQFLLPNNDSLTGIESWENILDGTAWNLV